MDNFLDKHAVSTASDSTDIRHSLAKGGIGARTALVDALEGLARRDEEKRLLNTYRTYIKNVQADQERLGRPGGRSQGCGKRVTPISGSPSFSRLDHN